MADLQSLAVNGGAPAISSLPDRFYFGQEERQAVLRLLDGLTEEGHRPGYQGAEEEAFGKEFADFLGGGFADGTNSGTNSVFVALHALHLPPFSEVVVGAVTDAGGAMPVVLCNCIPVPADTAPGSFSPGPEQIEAAITERTRAILVAHIFGDPADMPGIMKVADKYQLPVIEDCAQAHMARINGRNAGTFGAVGTFSLMFGKHMCSGGQGGAVFTKSEEMYWNLRRSADRGKPFGYPPEEGATNVLPALNCNMDEIHAVIARAQLKKLPEVVARRREAVRWLWNNGLEKMQGITCPQLALPQGYESCFWRMRLEYHPERMKYSMVEYIEALMAEGVPVSGYRYCPFRQTWYQNHEEKFPWNNPLYQGNPRQQYQLPNMDQVMDTQFILFILESYGEKELTDIIRAFAKVERVFAK